jgi:4'-phosphopantetheinyl transferase
VELNKMLLHGEVHVWVARPDAVDDLTLTDWISTLSEDERQRALRLHFEEHRREAIVSRALVRRTLSRYLGRPPASFVYRVGPHGRPYPEPPCGLHFNATNHPGLVACAICLAEEVGIDLEPLSRGPEILASADMVFSLPERQALEALPTAAARLDRAVSLWTCKEAYIKARGLGLSAPLREIAVDLVEGRRPAIRFLSSFDTSERWWLDTRDIAGFRIAVAVRASVDEVTVVFAAHSSA